MFLIGAEALDQLRRQLVVTVGETVGIGDLRAIEFQPTSVGGQFQQLETHRPLLRPAAYAERLDGPFAPFTQVGRGRYVAAIAAAADQYPIIASAATVYRQEMEEVGVRSQAGVDRESRRHDGGRALRQIAPTIRRSQGRDDLDAAGTADRRAVVPHDDIAGCGGVRGVGLSRGHLEVGLVMAGMAEAVNDISDLYAGGMRARDSGRRRSCGRPAPGHSRSAPRCWRGRQNCPRAARAPGPPIPEPGLSARWRRYGFPCARQWKAWPSWSASRRGRTDRSG